MEGRRVRGAGGSVVAGFASGSAGWVGDEVLMVVLRRSRGVVGAPGRSTPTETGPLVVFARVRGGGRVVSGRLLRCSDRSVRERNNVLGLLRRLSESITVRRYCPNVSIRTQRYVSMCGISRGSGAFSGTAQLGPRPLLLPALSGPLPLAALLSFPNALRIR